MNRYLVAFTAGWGDERRWSTMVAQLTNACRHATGKPSVALMAGCTRDAAILLVTSDLGADDLLPVIVEWMTEHSEFETTSRNPDRLVVAELSGVSAATDAVLRTAIGLR